MENKQDDAMKLLEENFTLQLQEKQYIIEEKTEEISAIKDNMESFYVENWTVTDSNGKKGEFSGNINWVKGSGIIYYKDKTYFEGCWYDTGEIDSGELRHTHTDALIKKWEDGEEVYE